MVFIYNELENDPNPFIEILKDSVPIADYAAPLGSFLCDIVNKNILNLVCQGNSCQKSTSHILKGLEQIRKELYDYTFIDLKDLIDCVFLDNIEYENFTIAQKYFVFKSLNPLMNLDFSAFIKIAPTFEGTLKDAPKSNFKEFCSYLSDNGYQISFKREFNFNSLDDFLLFYVSEMVKENVVVKKCENCGKYFIPNYKSNEIYCDNIFKRNKTCKQLGYETKVNNDDFLKAYRTAYKTKNAFMNRNKKNKGHVEEDFKEWAISAKLRLDEAQKGIISLEQFKDWLKS